MLQRCSHLSEFFGVSAAVRVVDLGQAFVGLASLVLRGIFGDAQDLVGLHGSGPAFLASRIISSAYSFSVKP